jgi:hypothetical protein
LIPFLLLCTNVEAKTAKDIAVRDTLPLEAISWDSTAYQELQAQKKFNYYEKAPQSNFLGELRDKIFLWMQRHLNPSMSRKQFNTTMLVSFIIFLILIVALLYIFKPSIFYINRKRRLNYTIDDDDIEGYNFELLIRKALENREYADAIRWTYLKALKILNENELISFDANKTVHEYVYEIKRQPLVPDFKSLSMQFVYFRYGNGIATENSYDKFNRLSEQLLKRL